MAELADPDKLRQDMSDGQRRAGPIMGSSAPDIRNPLDKGISALLRLGSQTIRSQLPGGEPKTTSATGTNASADDPDALTKQFYDEMNKPLDFNDPYVANIVNGAASRAQADADARGIGGGMGVQNSQMAYTNAAAQLQDAKQQRALQALGLHSQYHLQNKEDQYAADMNTFNARKSQGMGMGSTIGGVAGGLAGLAATAATGGAAAPSIGPLSSIGAGIGGWAGGNMSGGDSIPQWNGSRLPMTSAGY